MVFFSKSTNKQVNPKLIQAVDEGDVDKVINLLSKGAAVNTAGNFGHTVMILAFIRGNQQILNVLLQRDIKYYLVNDKIEILKKYPEFFKGVVDARFIKDTFQEIENENLSTSYLKNFILPLRKPGFLAEKTNRNAVNVMV